MNVQALLLSHNFGIVSPRSCHGSSGPRWTQTTDLLGVNPECSNQLSYRPIAGELTYRASPFSLDSPIANRNSIKPRWHCMDEPCRMVGSVGLEPTPSALNHGRSTQLSYIPKAPAAVFDAATPALNKRCSPLSYAGMCDPFRITADAFWASVSRGLGSHQQPLRLNASPLCLSYLSDAVTGFEHGDLLVMSQAGTTRLPHTTKSDALCIAKKIRACSDRRLQDTHRRRLDSSRRHQADRPFH